MIVFMLYGPLAGVLFTSLDRSHLRPSSKVSKAAALTAASLGRYLPESKAASSVAVSGTLAHRVAIVSPWLSRPLYHFSLEMIGLTLRLQDLQRAHESADA